MRTVCTLLALLSALCAQQTAASLPGYFGLANKSGDDPSSSSSPSPSPSPEERNDQCAYNKHHDKCEYVKADPDCAGTLVQYLELYACHAEYRPLLLVVYVVWTFLVFYLLGTTADKYFCPCLEHMSDTLGLGPRMAGVTLLSLGNGAPDVFSAIAAVRDGQLGLVLGDFSGGGMFVCSVVAGGVIWISKGLDSHLWHLKDVALYLGSIVALCVLLKLNAITHVTAGIMLVYYVIYVSVVFFTDRKKRMSVVHGLSGNETVVEVFSSTPLEEPLVGIDAEKSVVEEPKPLLRTRIGTAFKGLVQWFEYPFNWLRDFTVVVPTPSEWNREVASVATGLSPLLIGFWQGILSNRINGTFPVWALMLIIGFVLGVCVFLTSTPTDPPRWALLLLLLGFVNSAVWIDIFASELVEVLTALGKILEISQLFLGVTVLAWGNCVGDMTADWLMARNKRESTAITACYAGPLFNILIGLGFGVALRSRPIHVDLDKNSLVSFVFLAVTLAVTIVVALLLKPQVHRLFACVLWVLYAVYLGTVLVMEFA